jgi:hypothetical protein
VTFGNGWLGGAVQNTVDYNAGDGAVTINPNGANWNTGTIVLGAGITQSDVAFETDDSSGDLTLLFKNANGQFTGDSLTILGDFAPGSGGGYARIGQIEFADGSTISNVTGGLIFGATGPGQVVTPWANGETLTSGGFANTVLAGGSDAANYLVNPGDGDVTIANANGASQLEFGAGISDNQLWFTQSGNDLLVNVLGTQDQVDIQNWFSGGANAQLAEIVDDTANEVDAGLNQLIAAMATFDANNPAFNPETATLMPNDNNLQAAIAAAWHGAAA